MANFSLSFKNYEQLCNCFKDSFCAYGILQYLEVLTERGEIISLLDVQEFISPYIKKGELNKATSFIKLDVIYVPDLEIDDIPF